MTLNPLVPHAPGSGALRVALCGLPGAGKSTTAQMLVDQWQHAGIRCSRVSIGAPLYDVQAALYQRLGRSNDGRQDGKLLNFLGSHMRATDPSFLLADVERRIAIQEALGADVTLCDDARPVDLAHLRSVLGMTVVRITAPEELRSSRRAGRGDLQPGDGDHPTERGIEDHEPDIEIGNAGTIDDLDLACARLRLDLGPARSGHSSDRNSLIGMMKQAASDLIVPLYAENKHQIAAALLDDTGTIYVGLHIEAIVGQASVCAEAVALGHAIQAGAGRLVLVGAVRHPKPSEGGEIRFVPPCGVCRELLLDYAPSIEVILGDQEVATMGDLLPRKYVGTKWATSRPSQE